MQVLNGVREWFGSMRVAYNGRYPNAARAAYQYTLCNMHKLRRWLRK